MTDKEWKEYQNNTSIMLDNLESCIHHLLRSGRNISISRSGNSDTGKRVQVEITSSIDLECYVECINFRKDVFRYFKKLKKYFRHDTGYSVREVFILDARFGLTEYEFNYSKSLTE